MTTTETTSTPARTSRFSRTLGTTGLVVDSNSVDDWLTMIAAGQAVGMTSEATMAQYPRPGIVYRPVRDAERLPVWLVWWKNEAPPLTADLVSLAQELYAG